jgi:hypothetical protein
MSKIVQPDAPQALVRKKQREGMRRSQVRRALMRTQASLFMK